MKKTSKYLIPLAILTFIAFSTAYAQNDPVSDEPSKYSAFGIKFGRGVSDLWFIGEDYSYESPIVNRFTTFHWGISFNRNLSEHSVFNTNLLYIQKGRGGHESNHVNYWTYKNSPFEPIINEYLVLSSSVFFNTKGRIAVFAGPGIYQAILVHSQSNITLGWALNPRPRRFDLGVGLTAGIGVLLDPSILAKIEINGTSSVIPVFSKSEIRATGVEKYEGIIALNKTPWRGHYL